MLSLDQSYAFCRKIARQRARNFYYSFLLLSHEQKNAMCAIYAFMRVCDDLSDEAGGSAEAIERWREDCQKALQGDYSGHPVWPAFHDTVRRYAIPSEYFQEMLDGVKSDLEPRRVQTFDELYRYCYQVASVVGLTVVHIFGFDAKDSAEVLHMAEVCGVAFQITNILRDVREDAETHRIYLPAEDLARFDVTGPPFVRDDRFMELMRFEAARASAYYLESKALVGLVNRRSRSSLWALREIYTRLLKRIEGSDFDVLDRRIRVPALEKTGIVVKAFWMRGG